jgi:hypothetical protein
MKIKCQIQLMLSLASAMSLFAASTAIPGFSQPKVIDSWMQPSVTRTKSVTSSDGTTEKTVEPMIMERHEAVVVPTAERVTTNTSVTPAQVTQVSNSAVVKTASVKAPVVRKKRYVKRVYRHTPRRQQVAVRHTAQVKTVVAQPQIIQQRQTIEQKSVLITRPDPALKLN